MGKSAAASIGIVVGAGLIFGLGALGRDGATEPKERAPRAAASQSPESPESPAPSPPASPPANEPPRELPGRTFLAWAPGSLPAGTERTVDAIGSVRVATTVHAGLDWLEGSRGRGGHWQRPPRGYAIPFEVAAVEPNEYRHFAQPRDRAIVERLGPGEALLAETAAEMRGEGRMRLDLGERSLRVVGTVDDRTANGYEALIAGPAPAEWARADRFLLAKLDRAKARDRVGRAIDSLMPAGQPLQTRSAGENPFLRYGDAVLPQLLVKDAFGEFAARPAPGGTLELEPGWERKNVRTKSVPVLGRITCHRLLFPQLIAALRDIQSQGLAHAIHPKQFGGCFYPRFISSNPDGRISHHSWGIAVDLNAPENGFGTKADLDPRLVDIFEERWGFTWGGRWIIPDGMHFEWVKFP